MKKTVVSILLFAALAGIIQWVLPGFFSTAWFLLFSGDMAGVASYIKSFGATAVAISIAFNIFVNLAGIFPLLLVNGANGLLFGLVQGILISWIGETIGTLIAFVVYREILRDQAEKWLCKYKAWQKIDEFSGKKGFQAIFVARLIPWAPSSVITMIAAISRLSVRDFFWSTVFGKLPLIVLEVMIGHDAVFAREHKTRLTLLLILIVTAYAFVLYRKWITSKNNEAKM